MANPNAPKCPPAELGIPGHGEWVVDDHGFARFVAEMRVDVGVLIDLAEYCATKKLPEHRRITLEEFDRRADTAAATEARAHAREREKRAAKRQARSA